ncbi:MAG: superoxide dismutase, Cu-Zn family [Sphingomonadales bacterium]|jgi:Cu-Zn family superoxide dismutase|nr:superoxide dismutase, Cu-Zn family [Sphingomonadales bacterium]
MTPIRDIAAMAAALTLTGCAAGDSGAVGSAAVPIAAFAPIKAPDGRVVARAAVRAAGHSLRVRVDAVGLAPGTYGVHLHAVARCDPPGFASAGPHWNPTARQHGRDNPMGMHMGDLPNLVVGADGRGSYEYAIADATLAGTAADALLDADGAAVVIHAQADDYRTDPSGNSGARIACGVLVPR